MSKRSMIAQLAADNGTRKLGLVQMAIGIEPFILQRLGMEFEDGHGAGFRWGVGWLKFAAQTAGMRKACWLKAAMIWSGFTRAPPYKAAVPGRSHGGESSLKPSLRLTQGESTARTWYQVSTGGDGEVVRDFASDIFLNAHATKLRNLGRECCLQ